MKAIISLLSVLGLIFLVGCQLQEETMVLLDEKIAAVKVSKSNGFGEMNTDILHSFTDDKSIKTFKKAITTAGKFMGDVEIADPEYDVMVEYAGHLPTHGIHLWLGEENEKSTFMYIGDNVIYFTSPQNTKELRTLIYQESSG
ncbi:hypothetical protein GN156_13415 [bacterium LRH843]|nr:hypothetical protein [bacterium LRH843]